MIERHFGVSVLPIMRSAGLAHRRPSKNSLVSKHTGNIVLSCEQLLILRWVFNIRQVCRKDPTPDLPSSRP